MRIAQAPKRKTAATTVPCGETKATTAAMHAHEALEAEQPALGAAPRTAAESRARPSTST